MTGVLLTIDANCDVVNKMQLDRGPIDNLLNNILKPSSM